MAKALAFIDPSLSTQNVGDLFIADSVRLLLRFDEQASIRIDPRKPVAADDIDRINQTEAAVIVGTNLWYRQLWQPGRWMLSLADLHRIRVPIIPFGVGTTRHSDDDHGFAAETLALLRRIHESCAAGSARDPRTLEELARAGIANVSMTGCPTMFRSLQPTWSLRSKASRQVVVTVRHGQKRNVRLLARHLKSRGFAPIVAAQQIKDNFTRRRIPLLHEPLPTIYQFDIGPYLKLVEESLGAIGWRLHGNMIHLAHGNPAILFSNCSRGESFCEAFGLPRIRCPDHHLLSPTELADHVERLVDPQTFAQLPGRYEQHRSSMIRFLEANGLEHNLCPPPAPHSPPSNRPE